MTLEETLAQIQASLAALPAAVAAAIPAVPADPAIMTILAALQTAVHDIQESIGPVPAPAPSVEEVQAPEAPPAI